MLFRSGVHVLNNRWAGTVEDMDADTVLIRTDENLLFRSRKKSDARKGPATLFLRPEAMVIQPPDVSGLNTFEVTVKAILFDGANSRLLTSTAAGHELLVALPQNRAFDHIRPNEVITLGWHPQSGIAFARTEELP